MNIEQLAELLGLSETEAETFLASQSIDVEAVNQAMVLDLRKRLAGGAIERTGSTVSKAKPVKAGGLAVKGSAGLAVKPGPVVAEVPEYQAQSGFDLAAEEVKAELTGYEHVKALGAVARRGYATGAQIAFEEEVAESATFRQEVLAGAAAALF